MKINTVRCVSRDRFEFLYQKYDGFNNLSAIREDLCRYERLGLVPIWAMDLKAIMEGNFQITDKMLVEIKEG